MNYMWHRKKLQMNKYNTTEISVIDKEKKDGMGYGMGETGEEVQNSTTE